jgi:K+-sensing histidine kinase KdpD
MGIQPEEQEGFMKMEQERLLRAFASQAAVALERGQFWDKLCLVGVTEK